MVRELVARGARVTLHPCTTGAEELLAEDPDAVCLSNGPGDPAALSYIVETVRAIVGKKPVWGICLGHQLLCRAVGLETFKLPFGHHGANHPVTRPADRAYRRSPRRTTASPRLAPAARARSTATSPCAGRPTSAPPRSPHVNLV